MKRVKQNFLFRNLALVTAIVFLEIFTTTPAFAHHPLDGRLPANLFEGILSGFGHPILGFDHLAFVVASGLIAVGIRGGIVIPMVFVLATGIGAGIHLASIDLPLPEVMIAASVVLLGILLFIRNIQAKNTNYIPLVTSFAALAGIFHGHAYGEGIFGAEATPLIAYLIGFTFIQLAIALGSYLLSNNVIKFISANYFFRLAGGLTVGIGLSFLASAIAG